MNSPSTPTGTPVFRDAKRPVGRYAKRPNVHYEGVRTETKVLKKGTQVVRGALPLPCDILLEQDVAVKLRDGTTLYVDVFRPVGGVGVASVMAWCPYGKQAGISSLDDIPTRAGVSQRELSGLNKWEGPDPAYWVNRGYAVIHPDARGAFSSEGDIHYWGEQESADAYDVIEWVADRDWSNGKVGLAGNSWLAIAQWHIAAGRPPHLAAIAPWEGSSDLYRHVLAIGGVPTIGFTNAVTDMLVGSGRVEDPVATLKANPLMSELWESRRAAVEKIDIPTYAVASWTNPVHVPGTFKAWAELTTPDRWLRIHNRMEWPDFYARQDELAKFFDRYLRGEQNGWELTPRVRVSVLDASGGDVVERAEQEFPLERQSDTALYLDAARRTLSAERVSAESSVSYDAVTGSVEFTITFDHDTEIVGFSKLRLWVESRGSDDMDLFCDVEKLGTRGKVELHTPIAAPNLAVAALLRFMLRVQPDRVSLLFYRGAKGRLRVSLRELDAAKSTPTQPTLKLTHEARLTPGEIVPVDIPIFPTGMRWHAGETLRLRVGGVSNIINAEPGVVELPLRNAGTHVIHTGGRYDSQLLIPVIPS